MAEHVWRISPDPGQERDVRGAKITAGSGLICVYDDGGELVAIINLEKTKAVVRLDQLIVPPK